MTDKLSRRQMMQLSVSAAVTAGLASTGGAALAHASQVYAPAANNPSPYQSSINNAYTFLDQMMDAYAQGQTIRMCQSYSDQIAGGTFYSTAFVYDNALLALAYLARSHGDDLTRARIIGDALVYAQQHDAIGDGRFRQAYFAGVPDQNGVYVTTGLPFFQGSATGDVAWSGIALAQLYARTRVQAYLDAALRAANFIETTARDNVNNPPGGYFFGNGQQNKSTEHNIDVSALYTMLAQLTGNGSWNNGAQYAKQFVIYMFDPSGHFWTGTSDPTHIFYNNTPEDVQTWSYLAFNDPNYAISVDWVKTNLATTDTSFAYNNGWQYNTALKIRVNGVTYASLSKLGTVLGDNTVDADAVWIEGTGHLIAALFNRKLPPSQDLPSFHGDMDTANGLVENVQVAQNSPLANGQTVNGQALAVGQGLPASTSPLNTGFGFNYFPYMHIGATAWYVMGALGYNPMRLGHG